MAWTQRPIPQRIQKHTGHLDVKEDQMKHLKKERITKFLTAIRVWTAVGGWIGKMEITDH